jgi:hypothetical protein
MGDPLKIKSILGICVKKKTTLMKILISFMKIEKRLGKKI